MRLEVAGAALSSSGVELTIGLEPSGFSSFLCGRWWCILLLGFNSHPHGSMARVAARAIAVYGRGVQYRAGRLLESPLRGGRHFRTPECHTRRIGSLIRMKDVLPGQSRCPSLRTAALHLHSIKRALAVEACFSRPLGTLQTNTCAL